MKKIGKEEEKKIEREIEILTKSQEVDKFSYNSHQTATISLLIMIVAFILTSLATNYSNGFWGGLVGFVGVAVYNVFLYLRPIKRSFLDKKDMIILRYKKIGVNWDKLQEELDNKRKK